MTSWLRKVDNVAFRRVAEFPPRAVGKAEHPGQSKLAVFFLPCGEEAVRAPVCLPLIGTVSAPGRRRANAGRALPCSRCGFAVRPTLGRPLPCSRLFTFSSATRRTPPAISLHCSLSQFRGPPVRCVDCQTCIMISHEHFPLGGGFHTELRSGLTLARLRARCGSSPFCSASPESSASANWSSSPRIVGARDRRACAAPACAPWRPRRRTQRPPLSRGSAELARPTPCRSTASRRRQCRVTSNRRSSSSADETTAGTTAAGKVPASTGAVTPGAVVSAGVAAPVGMVGTVDAAELWSDVPVADARAEATAEDIRAVTVVTTNLVG